MPLSDKERLKVLNDLEKAYRRTQAGYDPNGVHWRTVDKLVDKLQLDAAPVVIKIPQLGPIVKGEESILQRIPTHMTTGIGWPAFDDGWDAGDYVIAPENCIVYDNTSGAVGGEAFYIRGNSKIEYWVGHITTVPKLNQRFKKGQVMTRISADHRDPHVHLAINTKPLTGQALHCGHNYRYTDINGKPVQPIGIQLRKVMV